jgi:hypothetical protein
MVSSLQISQLKFCVHFWSFSCMLHTTIISLSNLRYVSWYRAQIWSSSLHTFLYPPLTSSSSRHNILLGSFFSDNFNLYSSFRFRQEVSCPHKTTDKFSCWSFKMQIKVPECNLHLILLWLQFRFGIPVEAFRLHEKPMISELDEELENS